MRNLLRFDEPFIWDENCQQELAYLKNAVIIDPILRSINIQKDVVIMCDASQTLGFGYALLQTADDGKNLHVVSYGAQAVIKSQRNFTPAELELAALALAIKQYDYLLIHRKITVFTDNSAVIHLDKWKPINCLLYTSPSPRDGLLSRMPSSA